MFKHFEGARLGLFVFLGTVLLVVAIFLVGNKESLFIKSVYIKSYFTTVEGLRTGAPVRLSGLDIGSVSNIRLVEDTTGRVEVTMRIDTDLKQFIRLDSKANIETEGLVGSKIVTITPGSPKMEIIEDGGVIEARKPVSMTDIISETQSTMAYVRNLTRDFAEIINKVNEGQGSIGKLINDDELYYSAVNITQTADTSLGSITNRLTEMTDFLISLGGGVASIINNVDSAVSDVKILVKNIEEGKGVLGALIADRSAYDSIKIAINNLVQMTEEARQGTQKFSENMEALKHNWLFKGYFEERGYWDKEDYEKELDQKIMSIKQQNELLDKKIEELKNLGVKLDQVQNQQEK